MTYVFEHHCWSGNHWTTTLHHMTASELRDAKADESETVYFEEIHFTRAHSFVRCGGHHTTGLWIDNGRIRYAKGE